MDKKSGNQEVEAIERLPEVFEKIKSEIRQVIVGQDEIVDQLLVSLFARGHCLLIGVPGLAKTLLINTLGEIMDLKFSRIQFTPDLMPSDITGTEIIEEDMQTGKKAFKYIRGPVFANIILADEINRTPPKTQSALLEAMQEYKVTAAGESYDMSLPFFVLATQNPIEQEGTYPLPEAQLDRFMFNLWLDYPSAQEEKQIVIQTTGSDESKPARIISKEEIIAYQDLVRKIPVADNVVDAAVRLVAATRPGKNGTFDYINEWIRWGAGPRASQYLVLGAKVRSALQGRITPDISDIKKMALPVLRHRIVVSYN
ncbi:MAG: MoxR family ATPase, partial [Calditrichales bacterium]